MKKFFLLAMLFASLESLAQSVDTASVYSKAMGRHLNVVVVTPETYTHEQVNFPVVYVLHGYSGSYRDWIKKLTDAPKLATENNLILVFPDGGYSGWYADSKWNNNNQYETFISSELIGYMDSNYKTKPQPAFRAITGLSMGGHGALMLAMRHPEIYGAMGSMSGAVDLLAFAGRYEMNQIFGDTATQLINWKKYSVTEIADSFTYRNQPILIDCGIGDLFIAANRNLHQKLMDRKIPHTYIEREGVHNWKYWINALPDHLLFFRKYFEKPE